jgi:hypothetical protein
MWRRVRADGDDEPSALAEISVDSATMAFRATLVSSNCWTWHRNVAAWFQLPAYRYRLCARRAAARSWRRMTRRREIAVLYTEFRKIPGIIPLGVRRM